MTGDFTGAYEEKSGDGVARERGEVAENAGCCLGALKKVMIRRGSCYLLMHTIALKAGRLAVGNVGREDAGGGGGAVTGGGVEGFSSGQASAGAEPGFTVLP